MAGIDAPTESDQTCKCTDGANYPCGEESTQALKQRIGTSAIRCEYTSRDRYRRLLGTCYLGAEDLSAWMVRHGWALAYREYSERYVQEEALAKEEKAGLWAGTFEKPWDWRKKDKPAEDDKCGPYKNCTELRKDHPDGVQRGHCAYQRKMDRDRDGHACE